MKPSESPTFCPLLWLGATHWNSGVFVPCCQYKPDQTTNTWHKGFDDRPYKLERKMISEGGKPKPCRHCWINEEAGARSLRQEALENDWWHPHKQTIDSDTGEDGSFNHQPVYFDLRLGTKCNLACRMCSPVSSSLIEKELDEHFELFQPHGFHMEDYAYAKKNVTTDAHIDQVFDYIETTKQPITLKFTGGEPFLNQRIPGFVQKLIDSGRAKDIRITFITNLTTVKRSLLEDLNNNFKNFNLTISMEGIKTEYEYVRYPSTWFKFQKNFDMIQELGIKTNICYTGNSLTIGNFVRWLDWVFKYGVDWDFNPVIGPSHYNISCLPAEYKKQIIRDINEWRSRHPGYKWLPELDNAIGWLSKPQKSKDWEDLKKDTGIKDSIRQQSIHRSLPKLATYF